MSRLLATEEEEAYLEVADSNRLQARQLTFMTLEHLAESQEAMTQRIRFRESRTSPARSLPSELHPILRLQRTFGNRRLEQLIQAKQLTPAGKIIGLQRKLTVGAANDQYEQEADRLAHQVMNTSDAVAASSMQRAISPEQDEDRAPQPKPLAASITPFVPQQQTLETSKEPLPRQPESEAGKNKPIQVKSASALTNSFETADDVETQINRSKGRGSPLPDSVRTHMESRFGADFSGVRVHAGGDSARLNRSLSAQAFTVGREIYYGAGKSPTDLTLTAHELAHVVQQTGGQSAVQRQPAVTEVRNVELRRPPKRPEMQPAVPRAIPASMPLAEEIDAANQLTDDELLKRRREVALEAAAAANDADAAAREAAKHTAGPDAEAAGAQQRKLQSEYGKLQRTLDAIEYVAKWRRLRPLKADTVRYYGDTRRELANRRVNFRLMVEERVREAGSLKDALKGIPSDAEEVQAIRKEADDFGKSFKAEAWLNCERMLIGSQKVMFSELASYGLPPDEIEGGMRRLKEGKSEDEAAQDVVDQILKLAPDKLAKVNAKGPENKRARLVFKVKRLKERQQKVKDLAQTAGGLNTRGGEKSSVDAMNKAIRELPVAQKELAAEWMEAEREHQVLAAYRGDQRDLEKIDLTKLDVPAEETPKLMTEVLVRVLPKLYDNGRALYMLRHHQLKPMALAPVVALTSATMFVPEGSIRAGVVRDLVDEEKSSSSWLLTLFTVALAIVTLLPTGGMSAAILVPASIASAGLAAYSALKIYQKYEKQKLLVNTDLDLARALSNEQPSLSGFAFNLVMAGLEGVALFRLWRKAVEIRKLAMERQSLSDAIGEFKAIMNEQKQQANTDKFLDEVLRDTPAGRPEPKPAKPQERKAEAPRERLKSSPPKAPADIKKVTSEKAADLGYRDAEHVRAVVTDRLSRLKIGMDPKNLPKDYLDMLAVLKAGTSLPEKEILKHIDAIMEALRNPKLYGDVMADAYQIALANNLTIEEGIMILARKEGLTIKAVPRQEGVLGGGSFFEEYASKGVSIHDLPFKGAPNAPMSGGYHGSVTHIVQDLVINRARVGRTSYAFRKTLGAADRKITIVNLERKPEVITIGDYVWRSTYDLFARGHLPMPEMSGAVLKQFLKVH